MIKCKKQFIAFFMAISIVFCVGSESYIKAEALEWAIPTITAAEAIKWLLGLLGVTVAGAAIADTDYEQLVENYSNYAELQGQTAVETGKFWSDIIDGTLDTGSQAWANFKEWVSSLVNINGNVYDSINRDSTFDIDFSSIKNDIVSLDTIVIVNSSRNTIVYFGDSSLSVTYNNNVLNIVGKCQTIKSTDSVLNTYNNYSASYYIGDYSSIYLKPFIVTGNANIFEFIVDSSSSLFNTYNPSIIDNIALILSNAISDAIPDVIPLPWDQVSDTAEGINDKINELIEKVNEGVLSLEDYMIAIQSILGVIAFDTTTDLVIPSDPDLPDETIQDRINENVANNGFVLSGLENFFPFCIPFDIYAFITILVAEPVAPVIHWEIYNPVTNENNEIILDFAMWESIVVLMRYIFDFLFIIGLALLARSLIGGDD